MDNHERQQRSTWGGAVSSNACSSPDQALDDAMNRFGGLSLDVGITAATEHHHRQQREQQQQQQQRLVLSGASSRSVVGVNELAMGALCVGEATVRQSFTTQEQQGRQHQQPGSQSPPNSSTPSPWGTHPQHQYAQHLPQRQHQQQLMLQPQPHGLGGGGGVHRLGDGFCAGCKGRGIGAGSTMAAAAATGGRGQDGVWRDEHGRRLYTEDEVSAIIVQISLQCSSSCRE